MWEVVTWPFGKVTVSVVSGSSQFLVDVVLMVLLPAKEAVGVATVESGNHQM